MCWQPLLLRTGTGGDMHQGGRYRSNTRLLRLSTVISFFSCGYSSLWWMLTQRDWRQQQQQRGWRALMMSLESLHGGKVKEPPLVGYEGKGGEVAIVQGAAILCREGRCRRRRASAFHSSGTKALQTSRQKLTIDRYTVAFKLKQQLRAASEVQPQSKVCVRRECVRMANSFHFPQQYT